MPCLDREVRFTDGHGYEVVMPKNLPVRVMRRHKTDAECTIRGEATVYKRAGQDQEIRCHRIPEKWLWPNNIQTTQSANLDGTTYIAGMMGMPEPD